MPSQTSFFEAAKSLNYLHHSSFRVVAMATKISPRQLPVALGTELLNITELNFTWYGQGMKLSGFKTLLENYTVDCWIIIRKDFSVFVSGSYLSPQILTQSE